MTIQEQEHYPFQLIPLPYPYDALEPFIDKQTMIYHHDNHLKTYVDNLNKTLAPYPMYHKWSLHRLLCNIPALPKEIQTPVKNYGGGVHNHNLFFSIMGNKESKTPVGNLALAIDEQFGSYDNFKAKWKEEALSVFGSGYAWLVVDNHNDNRGKLRIVKTQNQDTPMPCDLCPVILIDVWEHAYYLKYQYRRAEYIDNWFNVIDWNKAEENYNQCKKQMGMH